MGRPATPASDVYRLGLVLYLLLTGRPAFDGPDANAVARMQVDGVVQPPQFRNPAVPPAIAQIVMRTLEKDPARRGTAAQLQADLERVMGSALVEEVLPEKPRSRAWIWATAVLVLVAAALAVAWAAGVFGGADETAAGQVTVPNVTGMTQSAARTTLEQAGLRVGDVTSAASTSGPSGTVVGQDPAAGMRVAENTAVTLIDLERTVALLVSRDDRGRARRERSGQGGRRAGDPGRRLRRGRRRSAERHRAFRDRDLPGTAPGCRGEARERREHRRVLGPLAVTDGESVSRLPAGVRVRTLP